MHGFCVLMERCDMLVAWSGLKWSVSAAALLEHLCMCFVGGFVMDLTFMHTHACARHAVIVHMRWVCFVCVQQCCLGVEGLKGDCACLGCFVLEDSRGGGRGICTPLLDCTEERVQPASGLGALCHWAALHPDTCIYVYLMSNCCVQLPIT